MRNWHFFEHDPRYKNREAMQGEFFTTEDLDNQYQALVREAIQNSLDARLEKNTPVVVRINLSSTEDALPPQRYEPYFPGALEHFKVKGSGLNAPPKIDEQCYFLLIEDFNTTGLHGNIREYNRPENGEKNPFFYFMHAEGQSGKADADRGRWGIGKFVFPKASRIKSFFVVTERYDDGKRLLAGQTILKSHKLDGKHYVPDGWFGELQEDKYKLPIEDEAIIEKFVQDFKIARKKNQSGTSIVVPFIELPEKNDSEDAISLLDIDKYVLNEYFYPIVSGDLIVVTDVAGKHSTFSADTIAGLSRKASVDPVLPHAIGLAAWSNEISETDLLYLSKPRKYRGMQWYNEGLFDNVNLDAVRKRLAGGEKVAIRVPVAIAPKSGQKYFSHFDIFIKKHPVGNEGQKAGKPIFIRGGITIPGVKCKKAKGYISLVIITDPSLARMLGDAENPAHTEWQSNSENFKGKYKYGIAMINFVGNSVGEFVNRINREDEEEDRTTLMDIFSIPDPENGASTPSKKPKSPGSDSKSMPDPPPSSKQRYNIVKLANGVRIEGREEGVDGTCRITAKFAYDIRGGSAIQKYTQLDFVLGKKGIIVSGTGNDLLSPPEITDTNALQFDVGGNDFSVEVTGFDENRDLIVAPLARKVENEEI